MLITKILKEIRCMSSKNLVSNVIHSFFWLLNHQQSALIRLCIHSLQQHGTKMQETLFSKDIKRSTNATLQIQ